MTLLNGILQYFVLNIKVSDYCASIPYKWNGKKQRLELKSGAKLFVYNIRVGLAILYLLLALVQIVWTRKDAVMMVTAHSSMFAADYVTNVTALLINSLAPNAVVNLFNRIIEYEELRHPPKRKVFEFSSVFLNLTCSYVLVF